MAFLGRYGGVSPAEFDEMDHVRTRQYAIQIARLRSSEIDLMLNLARFVAGAKIQTASEEVRG